MRYLFLLIISAACLLSCTDINENDSKPQHPESEVCILNEDVIVFNDDLTGYIISVSDNVLTLASNTPSEAVPAEGCIICAVISNSTPCGFLGRVTSIINSGEGYTVKTESVQLSEVFDELHIDTVLNISSHMTCAEDKDGNIYTIGTVGDTIWNSLSEDYADSVAFLQTKADDVFTIPEQTCELSIHKGPIDGKLYVKFGLSLKIDISSITKVNNFEISLTQRSGIEGEWTVSSYESGENFTLSDINYKFAPVPVPGTPIIIVPEAYSNISMSISNEAEFKTSFKYQFGYSKNTFTFDGNKVSFDSKEYSSNENRYFRFKFLECKSSINLSPMIGMKYGFWNDGILALGAEINANLKYDFEAAVSMNDRDLLTTNPSITVTPSIGFSLYAESKLFEYLPGNNDGRYSWGKDTTGTPFKINALPRFHNTSVKQTDKLINVVTGIVPKSLLRCEEKGFALFETDSDEPLEHKQFSTTESTKSTSDESNTLTFEKPSTSKSYTVRPYVVADGNYYYGRILKKRVKSVTVGDNYQFYYDNSNRLIKSTTSYGYSLTISYNGNSATMYEYGSSIPVHFTDGKVTQIAEQSIYYDSDGYLSRCSGYGSTTKYSVTDGNITRVTLSDGTSTTYKYTEHDNLFYVDYFTSEQIRLPNGYLYFSGPINRKLLSSATYDGYTVTYSYEFDEDGYVTKAISRDPAGEGTSVYNFNYEEYYE